MLTVSDAETCPPPDAHVAACGLFCTNCGAFRKGRCKGCHVQPAFSSCPVRLCCKEKGIPHCGSCDEFPAPRDYHECKKLNTFVARVFAFIFRTNRFEAVTLLRDQGLEACLAAKRSSNRQ